MRTIRFIHCLVFLLLAWLGSSVHAAGATGAGPGRILFVVGSSKFHGSSQLPASISFGEVVHAWDVFHAAGYAVDFVSPDGGPVPILDSYVSEEVAGRLTDERIMGGLRNTARPAQIDPARYRSVYYVGGSNAIYGVPDDPLLQQHAMHIYERNGGVVSAVCHGTAGLVNLRLADGRHLVAGKRITGYPEEYEQQEAAYFKEFPFLIGKTVASRGGSFHVQQRDQSHVEVDGRVVTGQNYPSARKVAQAVVQVLAEPADRQPSADAARDHEHAAVDRVMQTTLRAFETGDAALIFQALRKDGVVLGYSKTAGKIRLESAEEWAKGFTGAPAADEARRKRGYRILDVTEHAALVKLTLDYPLWDGVDYLSLAKIDGEWKIVSKSWSGRRKASAPGG